MLDKLSSMTTGVNFLSNVHMKTESIRIDHRVMIFIPQSDISSMITLQKLHSKLLKRPPATPLEKSFIREKYPMI